MCSKVCSKQFAFIGIDRRTHKWWPSHSNFDPKTSTTRAGLEPKKAKVRRSLWGSNQLSVKFDWVISININHRPQIEQCRGSWILDERGTLAACFLWSLEKLWTGTQRPDSWRFLLPSPFATAFKPNSMGRCTPLDSTRLKSYCCQRVPQLVKFIQSLKT